MDEPQGLTPEAPPDAIRVVVAVCTYRRNAELDRLLTALRRNVDHLPPSVLVGVVVVDDNPDGAARPVCDRHANELALGNENWWSGMGNTSVAQGLDSGCRRRGSVVLIVSALIESKRVLEWIRRVAPVEDAFLVIAGDGPQRDIDDAECERLLSGRHMRTTVPPAAIPALYRSSDARRTYSWSSIAERYESFLADVVADRQCG